MSIREDIQHALKQAMKDRNQVDLDTLRLVKGALLHKEKASGEEVSEEEATITLRGEVRKRRQTIEILTEHGKDEEAAMAEQEIALIETFLPQQLTPEQLEEKIRAYLAEHPEISQPGPLTGALKKALGDTADGKQLNQLCRKVLET
jgi:uncharacterized protein YqeY